MEDIALTIAYFQENEPEQERVRKLNLIIDNEQKIQAKINEIIATLP